MKVKMPGGYFEGESGVYYEPSIDCLFYLERGEYGATINDRFEMTMYPRYRVWSDRDNGELLVVNECSGLIRIGDL